MKKKSAPEPLTPSPCIGLCLLDRETGLCMGCLRSAREISAWKRAEEPERRAISARAGRRHEDPQIVEAMERWEQSNR